MPRYTVYTGIPHITRIATLTLSLFIVHWRQTAEAMNIKLKLIVAKTRPGPAGDHKKQDQPALKDQTKLVLSWSLRCSANILAAHEHGKSNFRICALGNPVIFFHPCSTPATVVPIPAEVPQYLFPSLRYFRGIPVIPILMQTSTPKAYFSRE
jgi:hypothetical protein